MMGRGAAQPDLVDGLEDRPARHVQSARRGEGFRRLYQGSNCLRLGVPLEKHRHQQPGKKRGGRNAVPPPLRLVRESETYEIRNRSTLHEEMTSFRAQNRCGDLVSRRAPNAL